MAGPDGKLLPVLSKSETPAASPCTDRPLYIAYLDQLEKPWISTVHTDENIGVGDRVRVRSPE